MWRGALRTLVFGAAGLALACATAQTVGGGTSMTTTAVKAKVSAAGKVDRDEIHLSKASGQQVQWDVDGAGPLAIVPDEAEDLWPLEVKCTGGHCEGTQKPDAKLGSHPYHTEVGEKAGADPVIIIDG